eukprot:TRINITY_DN2685_c1_g1_i1.p2 TRINITY_DN2685_c1_g1~~TRINITY_DN2685_c1_g1_i1.p2  ORF type:complete len:208 (+),score=44.28 TRINITY_DN2685_c1_g1_i1:258-881(+)
MSSSSRTLAAALLALGAILPAAASDTKPGTCAKPVWPAEARRYELTGTTTLNFRIDETGRPQDIAVARSSRWDMLDQASAKALAACEFHPEAAKKAGDGRRLPVQYVWSLDGGERSHPVLMEGSCPASERFSGFAPFDKGVTGPDGVLVRLLVRSNGTPFDVKAEARDADPALVQAAIDYAQACRFARDPNAKLKTTDTVTGRVLLK